MGISTFLHVHPLFFGSRTKGGGRTNWEATNSRAKLRREPAELSPPAGYLTLNEGEISGAQFFKFLEEKHPELEIHKLQDSVTLKGPNTKGRRFFIRKARLGHPISEQQWDYIVKNHLGGTLEAWKVEALAHLRETQE